MGVATAFSRASGFARTVALAAVLGVTAVGDAYNTANTVPNMVFTLVVGGVLTSAVVPILVEAQHRGQGTAGAAGALLGAAAAVGLVFSLIVAAAAPLIVGLLTSGAADRDGYDAYSAMTTTWLRWFAPQIGLYAVGVLAVSIMTAQRRLFLGAAAPILTNVITIAVLATLLGRSSRETHALTAADVRLLGAGTTAAVAAATAIQLWGARRAVPGLRPRWDPRHQALNGIGRRAGWMLVYVGANQVGLMVVVAVAARTPGGISAYQWAFAVMQLPYALIAVSIMSAAYPAIAEAARAGTGLGTQVQATAVAGLRWLVPAAVGLALLARPIAVIVVGEDGSRLVAAALVGFALSLVPFTVFQLLTRVSYAHGDTRSPAGVNVTVNLANIAAAIVLVAAARTTVQSLTALAFAHAGSYIVGVIGLGALLVRRGRVSIADLTRGHGATLSGAALMAPVLWLVKRSMPEPQGRDEAAFLCAVIAAIGGVAYVSATAAMRALSVRHDREERSAPLPET